MSARLNAALAIWQARRPRGGGQSLYTAYVIVIVLFVAISPVVRLAWLGLISDDGARFGSVWGSVSTTVLIAAAWSAALVIGRHRGPALFPPFPLYALATSPLRRSIIFRRKVWLSGLLLAVVGAAVAALVGGSLLARGVVTPLEWAGLVLAGAAVGLITTIAWLAGQACPRAAPPLAPVVAGLALTITQLPALAPSWVVLGLTGLAVCLIPTVPVLTNRLTISGLTLQAARWESAAIHTQGMDFSSSLTVYQAPPRIGRRWAAVRPQRSLAATFAIRGLMGALRSPARTIIGLTGVGLSAVLVSLATSLNGVAWLPGAAAGLLMFAGLGPLTAGLRHAVHIASDFPLYGVSDEALVGYHLLFPLLTLIGCLTVVVNAYSWIVDGTGGGSSAITLVAALFLGLVALIARLASALKGPLPPALLTPMPTPMGDVSAINRLVWAVDGVLLTTIAGAAATNLTQAPLPSAAFAGFVMFLSVRRWRHRR